VPHDADKRRVLAEPEIAIGPVGSLNSTAATEGRHGRLLDNSRAAFVLPRFDDRLAGCSAFPRKHTLLGIAFDCQRPPESAKLAGSLADAHGA
jgi:hypothetical protein